MSKQELTFGVANAAHTLRASTWRLASKPDGNLYLMCREFNAGIHMSMHPTDQWHVGFPDGSLRKLFDPEMRPPTRLVSKWRRPAELKPGWTLAAMIHTPWSAVGSPMDPDTLQSVSAWMPTAPMPMTLEFRVLLGRPNADRDIWSGEHMHLAGGIESADGSRVVVVAHVVPTRPPAIPDHVKPRLFKGVDESELAGRTNMLAWGVGDDGSAIFWDTVVDLTLNRPTVAGTG
jgi:hypothetical protein